MEKPEAAPALTDADLEPEDSIFKKTGGWRTKSVKKAGDYDTGGEAPLFNAGESSRAPAANNMESSGGLFGAGAVKSTADAGQSNGGGGLFDDDDQV
jgi:hypothetical protein